ncbi:hypothetical protein ZWY2020_034083 [Hordeum vulgare]|nr:hypothetical protein ZWY2020_034083 [Hordeum vulgare]
MAFLNMEQHTWAFTFSILYVYRVYRKKPTEGFQSTPYLVTLFSCLLWMYYASLKFRSKLLLTINGVGYVIETLYITMYMVYAPKSARLLTGKLFIGLDVGLFSLIALVNMLASAGPLGVQVVGWICVVVALGVFAAPSSIIVTIHLFVYSYLFKWLKKDIFVVVPNVLGFVFGIAHMALYMAYQNKKPATVVLVHEEMKLSEHVKEVAGCTKL